MTARHLQATVTCKVVIMNYKTVPTMGSLEKGSLCKRKRAHGMNLTPCGAFLVSDQTRACTMDPSWPAAPAHL